MDTKIYLDAYQPVLEEAGFTCHRKASRLSGELALDASRTLVLTFRRSTKAALYLYADFHDRRQLAIWKEIFESSAPDHALALYPQRLKLWPARGERTPEYWGKRIEDLAVVPSKKDATGTMLAANLRRFIVPDYQQVKLQDALKPKHWLRSKVMAFEAGAPDANDPDTNDYYWRKAGILDISAHLALGKNAAAAKLIDQMPDKSAGRQGWWFDEERVEDAAWKAARKKLTQLRKTL